MRRRLRAAAPALGVFALALALRLWTLDSQEASNPLFDAPVLDETLYLEQAARIREGEPEHHGWYLSPVWPSVLAALDLSSRAAAARLNAALGALVAALVTVGVQVLAPTGRTRSWIPATVAGLLAAMLPTLVFHDVTAGTEPLLALLSVAALLLLAVPQVPGLLGGVVLGLAALTRASAAGLVLAALPRLRQRAGAVAVLAGLALPLGLASGANLALHDVASPFPWGGGVNLLLGNSERSRRTAGYAADGIRNDPVGQQEDSVAAVGGGGPEAGARAGRWARSRALDDMLAAPGAAMAHLGHKALLLVHADGIGGNHDLAVEARFAPWTRVVPRVGFLLFGVGVAGWWWSRREVAAADTASAALLAQAALVVLVFPLERYRLALLPQLLVLAGLGVTCWTAASRRDRWIGAGLAVALAGVGLLPVRAPARPEAWTNLGLAAWRSAEEGAEVDPRMEGWFEQALAEDARFPTAHLMLGHLRLAPRPEDALRHFEVAARQAEHRTAARVGIGRALFNLGRVDDALDAARALAATHHDDADLWAEAAHVATLAGRVTEARRLLARAARLDAAHPHVRQVEELLRRATTPR